MEELTELASDDLLMTTGGSLSPNKKQIIPETA
jgi:hypothetical protein